MCIYMRKSRREAERKGVGEERESRVMGGREGEEEEEEEEEEGEKEDRKLQLGASREWTVAALRRRPCVCNMYIAINVSAIAHLI